MSSTPTTDTNEDEVEPDGTVGSDERGDSDGPADPTGPEEPEEPTAGDSPNDPEDPENGTEVEEDDEDTSELSTAYVALVRFAFPVAGLILAALYVESTYGTLRLQNLYYPYFVIGMLVLSTLTVSVWEVLDLRGRSGTLSFTESLRRRARKWDRSISLVFAGVAYIAVIDVIGFFPASFLGMVAIMLIGGLRDPKTMIAVTGLVLVMVYVLFIQLMGLQPPEGVLGI